MAALAGALAGVFMALIFIGHMAIVLVDNAPTLLARRAARGAPPPGPVLIIGLAIASPLAGGALGAGAGVLFSVAERRFPTDSAIVPSAVYLALVVAFTLASAPLPILLLGRLRKHLLFEYALFLAVFGLSIPWLASAV